MFWRTTKMINYSIRMHSNVYFVHIDGKKNLILEWFTYHRNFDIPISSVLYSNVAITSKRHNTTLVTKMLTLFISVLKSVLRQHKDNKQKGDARVWVGGCERVCECDVEKRPGAPPPPHPHPPPDWTKSYTRIRICSIVGSYANRDY